MLAETSLLLDCELGLYAWEDVVPAMLGEDTDLAKFWSFDRERPPELCVRAVWKAKSNDRPGRELCDAELVAVGHATLAKMLDDLGLPAFR